LLQTTVPFRMRDACLTGIVFVLRSGIPWQRKTACSKEFEDVREAGALVSIVRCD